MSGQVRVQTEPDGRVVAVKVALDPPGEMRLVREAAMLIAARQPGVVGLVRLSPGREGLELVTQWVGTRSLADIAPLPAQEAAGVVGALAATVADLHRHGIVHRGLDPSHVVLDGNGRPVLCSFGAAAFAPTMPKPAPSERDRHADPAGDARPSTDVAALGDVLLASVGRPDDPDIVPTRRFGRRHGNQLHRCLLTIADHARAHDPASRPSATAFAAALAELAPAALLPASSATEERGAIDHPAPTQVTNDFTDELDRLRATAATVRPRRHRLWPFGTAVVGAALLVTGATAFARGTPTRTDPSLDGVRSSVPSTSSRTGSPTTSDPPRSKPSPSTVPATPIVDIGGQRFAVGSPGDVVAVAPWRCDATDRALVLRPTTGALFLFDDVATTGSDAAVEAFATVAANVELVPAEPDDPCPSPAVVHTDGRVETVELPPRRA